MVSSRSLLALLLIGGLLMGADHVHAQNVNSIESRINRLENEMQTMSRAMFRGDVPPPQHIAPQQDTLASSAMEVRIGQIEEQLQRVTGRMEETQYQIRQIEERLQGLSSQAASRANSGVISVPSEVNGYAENIGSVVSPPNDIAERPYQLGTLNEGAATPAALYDEAFAYLQRNDYQAAEGVFHDFIKRYPEHSLVSNAKYWLGETYYARSDYTSASRAFARAFQDHPDSHKAPDMLLKLGMSLARQDKKDEACLTFSELRKRYPAGSASVMQTADNERQSLGCGS